MHSLLSLEWAAWRSSRPARPGGEGGRKGGEGNRRLVSARVASHRAGPEGPCPYLVLGTQGRLPRRTASSAHVHALARAHVRARHARTHARTHARAQKEVSEGRSGRVRTSTRRRTATNRHPQARQWNSRKGEAGKGRDWQCRLSIAACTQPAPPHVWTREAIPCAGCGVRPSSLKIWRRSR